MLPTKNKTITSTLLIKREDLWMMVGITTGQCGLNLHHTDDGSHGQWTMSRLSPGRRDVGECDVTMQGHKIKSGKKRDPRSLSSPFSLYLQPLWGHWNSVAINLKSFFII